MAPMYMVSFDLAVAAFLTCVALRYVFVVVLPDRIAGPGGWLVDTKRR